MKDNTVIKTEEFDFSRKINYEHFEQYQLHCHSYYELYYFISGNVKYMVEGKNYEPTPKSILLLKPGAVHGVQNTSTQLYSRYAFHFTLSIIPAEVREPLLSQFNGDSVYFENVELESSFDKVLDAWELPKGLRTTALSCRFQSLLTELLPLSRRDEQEEGLAYKITAYINSHLLEELTLDSIAASLYISKSQLSRILKKELSLTVGSYIALKRSSMARQMMLKGETAAVAAALSGFKDYSTFFRTYKKYMGRAPTGVQARE